MRSTPTRMPSSTSVGDTCKKTPNTNEDRGEGTYLKREPKASQQNTQRSEINVNQVPVMHGQKEERRRARETEAENEGEKREETHKRDIR